jgi:hypothetical protein
MIVDNELERMWQETDVAEFQVLFGCLPGQTEISYEGAQ